MAAGDRRHDQYRRGSRQNITATVCSTTDQHRTCVMWSSREIRRAIRISLPPGNLIRIKAEQGQWRSYAPEERFVSGDPMPLRPHSRTLIAGSVAWLAAAFLVLLMVTSTNAAIAIAPGHFTANAEVAIRSVDCTASQPAAGHAHCQTATFGVAGKSHFMAPVSPSSGSSVWSDADVTCCPTSIHFRTLRPPNLFRMHI